MNDPVRKLTTSSYTVRGTELDATGSVSPGWFSRILEHTRWQVFALLSGLLRTLKNPFVGHPHRGAAEYVAGEGLGPFEEHVQAE